MQANPGSAEIQLPVGLSRRWDLPSAPQPGGEGTAQERGGQCRGVHWGRCCFLRQKGNLGPLLWFWDYQTIEWLVFCPWFGSWASLEAGVLVLAWAGPDHLHTQVLLLFPWLRAFPFNEVSAFAVPSILRCAAHLFPRLTGAVILSHFLDNHWFQHLLSLVRTSHYWKTAFLLLHFLFVLVFCFQKSVLPRVFFNLSHLDFLDHSGTYFPCWFGTT